MDRFEPYYDIHSMSQIELMTMGIRHYCPRMDINSKLLKERRHHISQFS